MAEKRKGWLPPRDGGYKAVSRSDNKGAKVVSRKGSAAKQAAKQTPVPPKGGSGVSRPTKNAKE
jgi:hypothetical protein